MIGYTNLTHNFSCIFISILYMFRAAICSSSEELLYQCDTWFMSLCVDDCLLSAMCPSSEELLYQCDTWFMSFCVDD